MEKGKGQLKVASGCSPTCTVLVIVAALAFGVSAEQAPTADSVWSGVFTEEQAKRGEAVYQQDCSNCHDPGLEGADMTPPLTGGGFTSNWNDLTVGDLFERIRLTMPADSPGKLSRQKNADVIAFILRANAWPAGTTELSRELADLKQIKIAANKPPDRP